MVNQYQQNEQLPVTSNYSFSA